MTAVLLQIRVKPKARTSGLLQMADGTWQARVKSAPVDGKANAELIELIAAHFKCRKAAVSIKSGSSGRLKFVRLDKE